MQWLEVTIRSASAGMGLLEAMLTYNGYDSFIVEDGEEFQDFLNTNRDYWDIVDDDLANSLSGVSQVRLYLEEGPGTMEEVCRLRELTAQLKQHYPAADLGSLAISLTSVKNEDWENNWKQYYQPIHIGRRLTVIPQWMSPSLASGRIPVLLDPGMIFGTGAHASTQMCMMALEDAVKGGEQVIDLGSGSGILSITALLLGAAHAIGVDVDPKAEDIARENAGVNGIGPDRFTAVTGNIVTQQDKLSQLFCRTYDIVCLNIFADVIIPMAPVLPKLMGKHSLVICSGVLEPRADEVQQALTAAGLVCTGKQSAEDWCCFTAKLAG